MVILIGAGPRGERFARVVDKTGAQVNGVAEFLSMLRDSYVAPFVKSDAEDALNEAIAKAAWEGRDAFTGQLL